MAVEPAKYIDSHGFFGRGKNMGVQHRTNEYFKLPEFADTRFLVMPFQASSNSPLLERVQKDRKFLGMYLMFDPNPGSKHASEFDEVSRIKKLAQRRLVVGLKTLPSQSRTRMDDPQYFPYYAAASQRRVPVLIHAASGGQEYNSAEMTRHVLEKFPDLKIILAHFGGLKPQYMEEAVKLTEEFPNLYLNTTAMDQIGRSRRIDAAGRRYIDTTTYSEEEVFAMKKDALSVFLAMCKERPRQILFGSDLGYNPPSEYSRWPVTEVDETTATLIFIENPVTLFGHKMRGFAKAA